MRGSPTSCQSRLSHGAMSHTPTSSHIQHQASHAAPLLSKGKQCKKFKQPLLLLLRDICTLTLFSLLEQQLSPVTYPRGASGWDRSRSPLGGVEEAQEPARRQQSSRYRSLPRGAGAPSEEGGEPCSRCCTWQSSHSAIRAFHAAHFVVLFDVHD